MEDPNERYKQLKKVERETIAAILPSGIAFAGSLFATFQGLEFARQFIPDDLCAFLLVIIGIVLSVFGLGFFVSFFISRLENDFTQDLVKGIKENTVEMVGVDSLTLTLFCESIIFCYLVSEGLIIFSQIHKYVYSYPYLMMLSIFSYGLLSFWIAFKVDKLVKFVPVIST